MQIWPQARPQAGFLPGGWHDVAAAKARLSVPTRTCRKRKNKDKMGKKKGKKGLKCSILDSDQ